MQGPQAGPIEPRASPPLFELPMPLTPSQISTATRCPQANVEAVWPLIVAALEEQGIRSDLVEVAVAATVAVETGVFLPIRERRASTMQMQLRELQDRYWSSGYYGRGFVQLTWEKNYVATGKALGVDLAQNPDKALEPSIAARALAHFFASHRIHVAADLHDWRAVRRLVNGGYHGWDPFNQIVCALLEVLGE